MRCVNLQGTFAHSIILVSFFSPVTYIVPFFREHLICLLDIPTFITLFFIEYNPNSDIYS